MIDNNIIQSLGAGSGIDTASLVTQLTDIERAAPQNRIDTKRETTKTQISDFGLLSSALATLQDAAGTLSDPEGLFSKSASYTDSNALVPVDLSTDVEAGTYNFTVEDVAKSQSLSSTSFTDPTDAVGEGVLTFSFGDATVDGTGAMLTTPGSGFAPDLSANDVTITIDSTNNSLEGLRDAINDADFGVQASIVNDGVNGYLLQFSAASGANNELEISVSETSGTINNIDNVGLSRFAFNESASQLTQNQGGQDAKLTINGLTVYRESNSIDDIVDGLKLDVLQSDPGVLVNITVSDDKTFAEQNIRGFVEAYNLFLDAIEPAIATTTQTNADGTTEDVTGSLVNDSLAKSMISQIRSVIASAIPGLGDSDFTSLGAIGIRTELDGTISIDDDTFNKALADNFSDIQKLFAPNTATSDNTVYINSYNDTTAAGEYDVVITTPPTRGAYQGNTLAGITSFPNFDSTGQNYQFTIEVNNTTSGTITVANDVFADQDALAEAIQTAINADSALQTDAATVAVTYDSVNDRFDIQSTKYGSSSNVSILTADTNVTDDFGFAVAAGTAGQTVVGTVNGVDGFGSGNVLLPALGEPGEGLTLVTNENATSATVNFSRGFAGELDDLIGNFIGSNGLIATRETNLGNVLDGLDDDQTSLDRRMDAYHERLVNQYIAMESILNGLNTSGSFITNLIDTLPFTASNN